MNRTKKTTRPRRSAASEAKAVMHPAKPGLTEPAQQGWNAVSAVNEFVARMGAQVEPALYRLVCDPQHPMRANIDKALAGSLQTALIILAPHLVSEFKFSLVMASSVAAFAAQQVSARGQSALCAELTVRHAQAAAKPSPALPASPARGILASFAPEPASQPVSKPRRKPSTVKTPKTKAARKTKTGKQGR